MQRRSFLSLVAGAGAGLAGCLGRGGGGGPDEEYGDWFGNVEDYDGEVDRTGRDRVSVAVGADDGLAFVPAAVIVSPGTTVVWEWTGKGGGHNVVHTGGAFETPVTAEAGHTFEYTFREPGVYKYYCEPHRSLGMKGGVRVREA